MLVRATITLSVGSLTLRHVSIVQAAAAVSPTLTVTPSLREVSNVNGSTQFTLMTNLLPHDISVSDNVDWLTTSLTGNTLRADYSTNNATNARTATITVSGLGISDTANVIQMPGACGNTTLSTNSGSFSDGSGSNNYVNNVDCSWLVEVDFGRIITLNFSSFNTQNRFDFVRVYDGNSINAPLLGEFSGTALPSAITSSNNQLLVRFTSNGSNSSSGWEASYTSTATTILLTSASNVNLLAEAGSSTITVLTTLSTASITLTDNVDWLTTSLVSQTLSLNYTANTTSSFRTGTITLTGVGVSRTVTATQDFNPPPINLPFVDGFEGIGATKVFTTTATNSINGTSLWRYEKTNEGRLNFQIGAAFYRGGTHAATLDASVDR